MAAEIVVIGLAVVVSYLLYRFRQDSTESLFKRIQTLRTIIFGTAALIVALYLVSSGYLPYMIIGGIAVAYGVLWILFEEPHDEIRGWLP